MSDSSVHRYVLQTRELPNLATVIDGTVVGRRVLVLGEGSDAESIAERFAAAGAEVCIFTETATKPVDIIVDCNLSDSDPTNWQSPLRTTILALQACYNDWAIEKNTRRLFYVAVTRLGGEMGIGDGKAEKPLGGIWAGLAKTLPREFPNCNVRVVDVASSTRDVGRLVLQEVSSGSHLEVGYSNNQRTTLLPVAADPVTTTELGSDDTVVVTGGGRGIGWEFATHLSRTYGCKVFVSGRAKPPTESDLLNEHQLSSLVQQDLSNSAGQPELIRRARANDSSRRSAATLARNLTEARDQGLTIEYVQCDVRSQTDVDHLFERAGSDVTHVVHNAGVDRPVRLDKKDPSDALGLVSVKIDGLLNVLAAAANHRPVSVTVCGSLTGRFGGMVGQVDYAAANDGLARLCMWADQQHDFVVKCLSWPTWVHTGLVSNYDAAIKYMAAIEPTDGARRWVQELMDATGGEVLFAGPIGPALVPSQLLGTPVSSDLPDSAELARSRELAGRPVRYFPGDCYGAEIDLTVDEQDVVGTLLELCLEAADWTRPFEAMIYRVGLLKSFDIDAAQLNHYPGRLVCSVDAIGTWTDNRRWSVKVRLSVKGRVAGSVDVIYTASEDSPFSSMQALPDFGEGQKCRIVGQTVWYRRSDDQPMWAQPVVGLPRSKRIPIEHIGSACAAITKNPFVRWIGSEVKFGVESGNPPDTVLLKPSATSSVVICDAQQNVLVEISNLQVSVTETLEADAMLTPERLGDEVAAR